MSSKSAKEKKAKTKVKKEKKKSNKVENGEIESATAITASVSDETAADSKRKDRKEKRSKKAKDVEQQAVDHVAESQNLANGAPEELADGLKKEKESKKSNKAQLEAAKVRSHAIGEPEEGLNGEKKEKKSKKRKREEVDAEPASAANGDTSRLHQMQDDPERKKKSKKSKKRTTEQSTEALDIGEDDADDVDLYIPLDVNAAAQKVFKGFRKDKKDKKSKKAPTNAATGDKREAPQAESPDDETASTTRKPLRSQEEAHFESSRRFIVFVGNLPWKATHESIASHFSKIAPSSIRLQAHKDGKPKGFAFLEFDAYDKMKTCLKLYHHTEMDGRKINVELTAGGGGKSEQRKEKIRVKNEKLKRERKKDHEKKVEREQMVRKETKGTEKQGKEGIGAAHTGMHPDRMKRLGLR